MNKLKRFFFNEGSSLAYVVITAIFTLVPDDFFSIGIFECNWSDKSILLVNRLIVCVVVFILVSIIYQHYRKHRKSVVITDQTCNIEVKYGDLFDEKNGKKVINFDECFSINVGNNPEDIKPDSVCGQYLAKYPIDNIQKLIKDSGIKSIGTSLYNNKEKYAQGTIIPRGEFLLMAFAKLDKKGRGTITYDNYLKCLEKLWEQIDLYHGTDDVYLPIIGSKITRVDKELTQQELLDVMIASYRLSPHKLNKANHLHIICKERDGFMLNEIFGVA